MQALSLLRIGLLTIVTSRIPAIMHPLTQEITIATTLLFKKNERDEENITETCAYRVIEYKVSRCYWADANDGQLAVIITAAAYSKKRLFR